MLWTICNRFAIGYPTYLSAATCKLKNVRVLLLTTSFPARYYRRKKINCIAVTMQRPIGSPSRFDPPRAIFQKTTSPTVRLLEQIARFVLGIECDGYVKRHVRSLLIEFFLSSQHTHTHTLCGIRWVENEARLSRDERRLGVISCASSREETGSGEKSRATRRREAAAPR
jgi:hypothetical protein